jgi:stage II sporulation protein D
MIGRLRRNWPALAAGVVALHALAASCRSAPAARTRPRAPQLPPPSVAEGGGPSLRIGIRTDATRVSIAAPGAVEVWRSGGSQGERTLVHCASFAPVAASAVAAPRFRVQVASLGDEAAARAAQDQARQAARQEPTVRWSPETRTFQVRVGEFASREAARGLASRLSQAGLSGAWVTQEAPAAGGSGRIRFLESGEEIEAATIVPARGAELLTVDGAPYRGILEVRPNESGTLTVVNIVRVEDYLRGVVPNELSPVGFPQLEALKAQAVAARSYALRNRGQFQAKGYDLCDTPACQVYRGASSEHPLTDQAVLDTRGLVASYQGSFINALYTSTCGGHTEDGANVFEGEGEPYLKGVACLPESTAWATLRTAAQPVALGDEEGLGRDASLLQALGVLDAKYQAAGALRGVATDGELSAWTERLAQALHRRPCPSAAEPPLHRRGTFFRYLTDVACWQEREKRLLAPRDPEYLLQVEDRQQLGDAGERGAAALLLQEGVLRPLPDNTLRPGAALSRAQAVALLARLAVRAGSPALVTAEFRGAEAGEVHFKRGELTESLPLDPMAHLFRAFEGSRLSTSELTLAAGDRASYVASGGRVVFLEAEQSRLGAAADRSSRYFRWDARLTPAEVAQGIARYGSVGTVKDVEVRRVGVSGRVVELAVLGSQGELVLKGLRIRWGLNLRENLFVVDRERDAKGNVERFVFTGKGWGHGVGLCQVGAFGMAASGAGFESILKHYYTAAVVERAY